MKNKYIRIGIGLAFLCIAWPDFAGPVQKYAITIFEENVGRFSAESFVRSMIVDYLNTKKIGVLETFDIPLKSIRMEKIYFLDRDRQKVFKTAFLSAGLSASGMKLNSEYQENLIPVIKYEDIVWELDYDKAIEQSRANKATMLIAGKVVTDEISVQTQFAGAGMKSVTGRIFLRVIDTATKSVVMSFNDSLTMMGGAAETAGLDAIKALGQRAIASLSAKLIP